MEELRADRGLFDFAESVPAPNFLEAGGMVQPGRVVASVHGGCPSKEREGLALARESGW